MTKCFYVLRITIAELIGEYEEGYNHNYGRGFVNCETNPEARKVRFDVHQPISRFSLPISVFSPRIWDLGFIFRIPNSEEMVAF
jgi:hypothetical protein